MIITTKSAPFQQKIKSFENSTLFPTRAKERKNMPKITLFTCLTALYLKALIQEKGEKSL